MYITKIFNLLILVLSTTSFHLLNIENDPNIVERSLSLALKPEDPNIKERSLYVPNLQPYYHLAYNDFKDQMEHRKRLRARRKLLFYIILII